MRDHTEAAGEPHLYGLRGGEPMVLLFNEENDPQWELVEAADIESLKIWLEEHVQKREIPPEFDPDRATN